MTRFAVVRKCLAVDRLRADGNSVAVVLPPVYLFLQLPGAVMARRASPAISRRPLATSCLLLVG